ncbi:MAG: hypothetical protein ACFE95_13980 [Candidatus Hodarchaeota archaeon]
MSFSDKTINLSRYECARCNRTPEKAREVFQGCICGHRLFRIKRQNKNIQSDVKNEKNTHSTTDMDFLTICEREIGVYDINVEKMLVEKTKKGSTPIIAGNKGVFSIRFENLKN